MSSKICTIENCESIVRCRGLCTSHYRSLHAKGLLEDKKQRVCKVAGCTRPFYAKGFCSSDYQIMFRGRKAENGFECMVENCPRPIHRELHCMRHYLELYPASVTSKPDCNMTYCTEPRHHRALLCERHLRLHQNKLTRQKAERRDLLEMKRLAKAKAKLDAPRCIEAECDANARSMNRCQLHYNAWKNQVNQTDDFWSFVKQELRIQ